MASRKQKGLIGKIADAGEEALHRVTDMAGAEKVMEAVHGMRDRLDDVQKRLVGLDAIEKRLAALEQRVEELAAEKAKPKSASTRARSPRQSGSTGAKPKTTRASSTRKTGGGSPG